MSSFLIKEDFLHYLWKTKKIPLSALKTQEGEDIDILDFGTYNKDAGPDFFNAKVKIGKTVWAGNIEMHVLTSDWKKHQHFQDKSYDNVVLHVVFEDDVVHKDQLKNANVPTLALKGKIPKYLLDNYVDLIQSKNVILCRNLIQNVDLDKISLWKYALVAERLQIKSQAIKTIFEASNYDWEETFYIVLAKYFGSKVNVLPFESLAKNLPYNIIQKNLDQEKTIEALIFGQAGMLEKDTGDDYYKLLQNEYRFQQKKYNLTALKEVIWKFSKLRPSNFPTIRLAQFVYLLRNPKASFNQIKEANYKEIRQVFFSKTSEYWSNHYQFNTPSSYKIKNTGSDFVDILLINVVAPMLYFYGVYQNQQKYVDKAIEVLENTSPETNNVTKLWKEMNILAHSSFDSQALIQLKNNYCDPHYCLSCKIGHEILHYGNQEERK